MKRFITYILLFAILSCSMLLAGCGKGKETEFGFTDPKTGIEYKYCTPMKLYPLAPNEDDGVYLTVENENGTETDFFKVQFEDPEDFLCYKDAGFYFLAINREIEEPSVMDFNPIAAFVYGSTNITKVGNFYADDEYLPDEKKGLNPSQDSKLCKMIAEHITNSENVNVMVSAEQMTNLYYIRLLSQDYPGVYYLVSFFEYNGRYFLSDSSIDKTVYCPRDIWVRIVGE